MTRYGIKMHVTQADGKRTSYMLGRFTHNVGDLKTKDQLATETYVKPKPAQTALVRYQAKYKRLDETLGSHGWAHAGRDRSFEIAQVEI